MGEPLDEASARALVLASPLFDEQWYAATCGVAFGSREEAVDHWLAQGDPEAAPHPLFEPRWVYPRGRWRRLAPDPLSCYLAHPDEQRRSPHPLVDLAETGPLEQWVRSHEPAELLGPDLPRDPAAEVLVVVQVEDLGRGVAWARHLAGRSPEVTAGLVATGPAAARVLRAVARGLPSVRVTGAAAELPAARVTVTVAPPVRPPRWPWLPELLAALDDPEVAAAQPLLLDPDFAVAAAGAAYSASGVAPLLAGHPATDADRLARLPLPGPWPGVLAVAEGRVGHPVLVPASRLVVDAPGTGPEGEPDDGAVARTEVALRAAGLESPGRPLTVREGRPALRWAIDVAAPAAPRGRRWGDWHFASSLAAALERLGQWVAIDHPETRGRASRSLDDVVVTIRGLHRVEPAPGPVNLLWVISHPDEVSADEAAAYDGVYAASTTWAADRSRDWGLRVEPLLQCTDTTRFRPGLAEPGDDPGIVFVANARGVLRPSVEAALAVDTRLTVYGAGWEEWLPTRSVDLAPPVANDQLGRLYAGAALVLNDHWEDMRAEGFVSNRVFDVLATGGRLLSDDVAGLADVVGVSVPTWRTHEEFRQLTIGAFESAYPSEAARLALAERVVAEHSFDARAGRLLDAALRLRAASGTAP